MMNAFGTVRLLVRGALVQLGAEDANQTADYDNAAATYDAYYALCLGKCAMQLLDRLPIREGSTVADLACGTGFATRYLAERVGPQGYVIGVDLSQGMLARNQEQLSAAGLTNARLVHADVLSFLRTTPDHSLDGVVCVWGVCYLELDAFMREARRVLKPGGFLGVVENTASTLRSVSRLFTSAMARHPEALVKRMHIALPHGQKQLVREARRAGLHVQEAWEGGMAVPCRNGREIVDYMVKSGASSGFLDSLDKAQVDQVLETFVQLADRSFATGGGVEVRHDFCALIARGE
ncbi:class I SAM-dependent methyltransferase [Archangium gephyra]|uniref:class I SAM-dependent methyltransferase n=1 Tax=Archangium gephyra TaxID=48 RepID=UPI0035D4A1A2